MSTKRSKKTLSSSKKTLRKSTFTQEDYDSDNGMLVYIWGPSLWHVLHTISFNYPTHPTATQKKQYKNFIKSLQHVLPCGYCRENLKNNLKTTNFGDDIFENRETFIEINSSLQKRIPPSVMREFFEF